jgi:hypothetical protein
VGSLDRGTSLRRRGDERHGRKLDAAGAAEGQHPHGDPLADTLTLVVFESAENDRDRSGRTRQEIPVVVRVAEAPHERDFVDLRIREPNFRKERAKPVAVAMIPGAPAPGDGGPVLVVEPGLTDA